MCVPPVTYHAFANTVKKKQAFFSAFLVHMVLKTCNPALTFQMVKWARLSIKK